MSRPAGYLIIVDKPTGQTSFAVVKQVRKLLNEHKVGHTGTLDPLATGVLPICLGEATKIAGLLLADDKAYLCTGRLGLVTDSRDVTGKVIAEHDWHQVKEELLHQVLCSFIGEQLQVPPNFSAIREDGKRAYDRARDGEQFELAPRPITIKDIKLELWSPPEFKFTVECSKGTYVRSLVHDIGMRLGCGAAVAALRRIRSGSFSLNQSVTIEQLSNAHDFSSLPLVSMQQALAHLPIVDIFDEELPKLRQGQPVERLNCELADLSTLLIMHKQQLIALGEKRGKHIWPTRVFQERQAK